MDVDTSSRWRVSARIPRRVWFLAAVGSLALSSLVASRQAGSGDFDATPSRSWWRWFLEPVELNRAQRLDAIDADLRGVFATDAQHVWAVGRRGTIAFSADGGAIWVRQPIAPGPAPTRGAGAEPTAKAPPAPPAKAPPPVPPAPPAEAPPEVVPESARDANLIAVWVSKEARSPTGYALGDRAQLFNLVDGGWVSAGRLPFASQRGASVEVKLPLRDAQYTGKAWRVLDAAGKMTEHPDPYQYLPFDGFRTSAMHVDDSGGTAILAGDDVRLDHEDAANGFSKPGGEEGANDLLHTGDEVWTIGDGGRIRVGTSNFDWRVKHTGGQHLRGIFLLGEAGWAVGDAGAILGTGDRGDHWVPLTRAAALARAGATAGADGPYLKLPAPWYAAAWLVAGLLLVPAVRRRQSDLPPPESFVADEWLSDRPLESGAPDPMGFGRIVLGLSRFLRNENTLAPLTIAVTGEWGTGKSSLMNLLRANLASYGFSPVWFNAWHHQKEEHLLASLLQAVRLQAVPPWLTPAGLLFRFHLLLIRSWRHAVAVALLLAVLVGLVTFELGRQHPVQGGLPATLSAVKDKLAALTTADKAAGGPEPSGVKPGGKDAPGAKDAAGVGAPAGGVGAGRRVDKSQLALLLSALLGLISMWRGFRPFGVNPASLLGTAAGALKLRDLDAQTSFRQRFATEFDDVTRALGNRPMIIFVDDLDRCHPARVLDVLEAINFLVSSGQCYVLMGMARTRVEPAIALSFRDIAEEMDTAPAPPAPGPAGIVLEDARKQRRAAYARQYLDKLINIEIPVPPPTGEQAKALLGYARHADAGPAAARRARLARRLWPVGATLALAVLGGLVGDWMASGPGDDRAHERVVATATVPATTVTPTATVPATAVTPTATVPATTATATAPVLGVGAVPSSAPAAAAQTGEVLPPNVVPDWIVRLAVGLAAALALLSALLLVAFRRLDLVVKDSSEFTDALGTWHPLIFSVHTTPRALKRFRNRVRYLAMLQRPVAASPDLWTRLRQRLRLTQPPTPAVAVADGPATASIPESALVALAAIQDAHPDWLRDPGRLSSRASDPIMQTLLSDPAAELARVSVHVGAFVKAAAGISIR